MHGACGGRNINPKGEYLEILEFTHFSRVFRFDGEKSFGRKKRISNGINVSVVMELV